MKKIILAYLGFLETADYNKLINLFSDDAVVYSPLYGQQMASAFYKKLFSDTSQSKIQLINIFTNPETKGAAAYFHYDWLMKNELRAPFDVVDIFQFNERGDKITSLKIIYDTFHTREQFNKNQSD